MPSPEAIRRAERLSYAQAFLGAVYIALTTGPFLVGYAQQLGATERQVGLIGSLILACVVGQVASAGLIARGVGRRRVTLAASLLVAACWPIVASAAHLPASLGTPVRLATLVAGVTAAALLTQVAMNARLHWLGDLIPAGHRGRFFGRIGMYAGLVTTTFALAGGAMLDAQRGSLLHAFTWLFAFATLCALLNAALFAPQPEVPLPRAAARASLPRALAATLSNRPLAGVIVYAVLWGFQGMGGLFYQSYMLETIRMSYVGVGVVNGSFLLASLLGSRFWGRVIDRYGCRPVLIACTCAAIPAPLTWYFATSAARIYALIIPLNLYVGIAFGGVTVALATLIYKVTPEAGRSAQMAVYAILVALLPAPLPLIGGYLPGWLQAIGIPADIRCTFYASTLFLLAATAAAKAIREPDSSRTGEMIRGLRPAPRRRARRAA